MTFFMEGSMTKIWTAFDTLAIVALVLLIGTLTAEAQVCIDLGGGDYVCRGSGGSITQCSNLGGTVVCR
jgi:hypothetical protein